MSAPFALAAPVSGASPPPGFAALPCAGVWRASDGAAAGVAVQATCPSGHAALDAQLPGGGWPCGALVEVLQPQAGLAEWQLVLPALVGWQHRAPPPGEVARTGVVLVAPPQVPMVAGLLAQGLQTAAMLVLQPSSPSQGLWACEQALQSPAVGAVMAWLPHAPMDALRRLQLAATRHAGLLWVFRPAQAQQNASPATLRLRVNGWSAQGQLQVSVLKRRGPPLASALALEPPYPGLRATLAGAAWRNALRRAHTEAPAVPVFNSALPAVHHAAPVARPVAVPV